MTARPTWLDHVATVIADAPAGYFSRFAPPERPRRRSAVLMLFGPTTVPGAEVDVVLTERAATLRSHAGQVSFPGGALDPGDDGPVAAALRESQEEVGIDPASVEVVGTLPPLYLSPSANSVVPVLGWWPQPGSVGVVDPGEVARVERVPVAALVDPVNRFTVAGPSGFVSPAFEAGGLFVWGFTAMLLDVLLDAAGIAQPWDPTARRPIPPGSMRTEPTMPDDPTMPDGSTAASERPR